MANICIHKQLLIAVTQFIQSWTLAIFEITKLCLEAANMVTGND